MKITYSKDENGKEFLCGNDDCELWAVEEFSGYCEKCWIELSPADRAILNGQEPPCERIITHETVRTITPPPPSVFVIFISIIWKIAITIAVAFLVYKQFAISH